MNKKIDTDEPYCPFACGLPTILYAASATSTPLRELELRVDVFPVRACRCFLLNRAAPTSILPDHFVCSHGALNPRSAYYMMDRLSALNTMQELYV